MHCLQDWSHLQRIILQSAHKNVSKAQHLLPHTMTARGPPSHITWVHVWSKSFPGLFASDLHFLCAHYCQNTNQTAIIPGGQCTTKWRSEAGNSSLSTPAEGLCCQFGLGRWVDPPEWPFTRLFLRTRHFDKIPVQGQVVPNGILKHRKKIHSSSSMTEQSS